MTRDQARKIYDLCCASRATTRQYMLDCVGDPAAARGSSAEDDKALLALLEYVNSLVTA